MGVDANLYLGVRDKFKDRITDDAMLRLGWALGERFGYDSFFMTEEAKFITISHVGVEEVTDPTDQEEVEYVKQMKGFAETWEYRLNINGRWWSEDYARGPMLRYCDMMDFILLFTTQNEFWDPSRKDIFFTESRFVIGYGNDYDEEPVSHIINSHQEVNSWRVRYYMHGRYSYTNGMQLFKELRGNVNQDHVGCKRCVRPPVDTGGMGGLAIYSCMACGAKFAAGLMNGQRVCHQVSNNWFGRTNEGLVPNEHFEAIHPDYRTVPLWTDAMNKELKS